uniref:NADH-ubiquinone oxidoreductase chain 6 n=1 Tax=Orthopygia glaucinalis TaxID=1418817 RepID=A0A6H0DRU2_9NEOP|nr:NADH dehydrogenase subunit 6 [Orthopygia glaucinalis]QIS91175.1 NADH dehydrogenase subunit 6 [Orthopygia glaucinalis]
MIKMFLITMMMFLSFIMFFINHPLAMGLMILIQTLFICLLTGMLISTYWFSYILFLTFLGGLLVLFIYVTSIASNEMFKFNMNFKFIMSFILFFSLILYFSYNNFIIFNNLEMNNFYNMFMFFNNENMINLSKLYNNQTFLLILMLIIYLFITLIAVIKITNIFYGPLRATN